MQKALLQTVPWPGSGLLCLRGGTPKEATAYVSHYFNATASPLVAEALGGVFIADPLVLWTRLKRPAPSTLAHELLHVTVALLHRAGQPLDPAYDEAYAYTLGHLIDEWHAAKWKEV